MAQSRCSFSILIRYGSLKVSSINAFLDCWNRTGMIVTEELLSREWKCHGFSHLARRKREETRIFLPSPGGPAPCAHRAVRPRRAEDPEIIGSAPDLTRGMIEIRGLGILNVAALFGVGAVRMSKRLDLIVELVRGSKTADLERVGVTTDPMEVMGLRVERVTLPVEPGRDVAGLIELAAMNYKLRAFGYNSAVAFDQSLLKKMSDDQIG